MPLLGFEPFLAADDEFAYRPAGGQARHVPVLLPGGRGGDGRPGATPATPPASSTWPSWFPPAGRSTRSTGAVVELGSTVLEEPRAFPQYPPPYYATFWLDPHGFMLEAVCHHDRP